MKKWKILYHNLLNQIISNLLKYRKMEHVQITLKLTGAYVMGWVENVSLAGKTIMLFKANEPLMSNWIATVPVKHIISMKKIAP